MLRPVNPAALFVFGQRQRVRSVAGIDVEIGERLAWADINRVVFAAFWQDFVGTGDVPAVKASSPKKYRHMSLATIFVPCCPKYRTASDPIRTANPVTR